MRVASARNGGAAAFGISLAASEIFNDEVQGWDAGDTPFREAKDRPGRRRLGSPALPIGFTWRNGPKRARSSLAIVFGYPKRC
jgi:hypothetical protein